MKLTKRTVESGSASFAVLALPTLCGFTTSGTPSGAMPTAREHLSEKSPTC